METRKPTKLMIPISAGGGGLIIFSLMHFYSETTREIVAYGGFAVLLLLAGLGFLIRRYQEKRDAKALDQ
jgi:high-affinity Fe2+/Pb2+ permease